MEKVKLSDLEKLKRHKISIEATEQMIKDGLSGFVECVFVDLQPIFKGLYKEDDSWQFWPEIHYKTKSNRLNIEFLKNGLDIYVYKRERPAPFID